MVLIQRGEQFLVLKFFSLKLTNTHYASGLIGLLRGFLFPSCYLSLLLFSSPSRSEKCGKGITS